MQIEVTRMEITLLPSIIYDTHLRSSSLSRTRDVEQRLRMLVECSNPDSMRGELRERAKHLRKPCINGDFFLPFIMPPPPPHRDSRRYPIVE